MDLAAAEYAFNDNIYRRVATRIKDALDPDGILSHRQARHRADQLPPIRGAYP
jgi:hypothetical protein